MRQEQAETIALNGVAWLTSDPDLMSVFLGATGASAGDIRARLAEPDFLGSVLDFLLMDDRWVIGFCDANGLPYDQVRMARQALPGGAQPDWT